MSLDEFIEKTPATLDKNDSLINYVRLLKKTGNDKVVILENKRINEKYVKNIAGVVSSRDVVGKIATERLRLSSPGRLRVSGFMSIQPLIARLDTPLSDIVKTMASKSIGILPIVGNEGLEGAIYRWSLLKLAESITDPVSKIVKKDYLKIRVDDSLLMLRQGMLNRDESFAVVVGEDGKPIGYITIMDLAYAFTTFIENIPEKHRKERIEELVVRDYYKRNLPVVSEEAEIYKAARILYGEKTRGVLVLNNEGKVSGVVREHDLIGYLALTILGITR
ncbi:CBS domain-containing protein [Desulfurococcus amylolyticus]|uniref:CBS domain containing protein n=1 Tax=Desulfurococcus amylolyticus (strain DSM 18924 / JCM 16383 / VKM B-2413 / 1221n) TaxID=490899 RepID=B8D6R6_DESA1|nr:CBS domain-containing protein [Desulfurococcus amylolyticus]ACL11797.1 CBS domain containing protein [Desulfurococcus amylolyticus 1221n]